MPLEIGRLGRGNRSGSAKINLPERNQKRMGFFVGAAAAMLLVLLFGPLRTAVMANRELSGVK